MAKQGDKEEDFVFKNLRDAPWEEPIFIIRGQEYCRLRLNNVWTIGEEDIILMSRTIGIVNISIKSIAEAASVASKGMSKKFRKQVTKNVDSFKGSLEDILDAMPQSGDEKKPSPSEIVDVVFVCKHVKPQVISCQFFHLS